MDLSFGRGTIGNRTTKTEEDITQAHVHGLSQGCATQGVGATSCVPPANLLGVLRKGRFCGA